MNTGRFTLLSVVLGVAIVVAACATTTPTPASTAVAVATEDETLVAPTEDEIITFQVDPEDLQPCGAFETMRLLETPAPAPTSAAATTATPAPTSPPNPNAVSARPAPTEDRVGFPENYATDFKLLFAFDRPDRRLARAICGNEIAARRRAGEPYEYGSVLLMISYAAKLDPKGKPVLDENGHYIRTNLVAYHVMRKEKGFGEAYGADRAGEWEFVGYKADGSYETRPENSNACAACHVGASNESVDFVFRTNMINGGEAHVDSPPIGDNEVSIYLYGFHMSPMTIKVGTTLTWINNDEAKHTIMAAVLDPQGNVISDPNALFASGVLPSVAIDPNSSFSFTFNEAGEFLYMCTIHKNMVGKIIVTE
jgi:plastocyanin